MMSNKGPVPRKLSRQRLSSDERIPQILHAAAQEFSRKGFQQTRVEDIARAAGLSKGGFYAHFTGKEAVFDALLRHHLSGISLDLLDQFTPLPEMAQLIDQLSELLTEGMHDDKTMVVFRLLLADGWRVPEVVQSWVAQYFDHVNNQLSILLRRCVEAGICKHSVLVDNPWMVLSPVVHSMVARLIQSQRRDYEPLQVRQHLNHLLREMLLFEDDLATTVSRAGVSG